MADVTFTTTAVKPTSTSVVEYGYAGATIARGNAVYLSAGEYYVCDCTDADKDACVGFALNGAADGQALAVHKGGDMTCDGLTAGSSYVLSEAGLICAVADLLANDYVTYVGTASSATNLKMPTSGPVISSYKLT